MSHGRHAVIDDCTVHNNTVGVMHYGENTTLTDCFIQDNDVGVSTDDAYNLTVAATFQGNTDGVSIQGGAHISIQGALFANNTRALSLEDTHHVSVAGCVIETSDTALAVTDASDCRVVDNDIHDDTIAVTVLTSSHNTFSGNILTANQVGFLFSRAPSNTLHNNTMVDNDYAIDLEGSTVSHYEQEISSNNTVNGRPVHYLVDRTDITGSSLTPDGQYGYLGLVSCDNVTVAGATTQPNGEGLLLVDVHNVSVEQGTFTHSRDGVVLFASNHATLADTNSSDNTDDGVTMTGGTHNVTITNCTVTGNGQRGVNLYRSTGSPGLLHLSDSHIADSR